MKHSTLVLLNLICLSNITIYSMNQNNNKRRFTKNELLNRQRSLIRTQLLQTPKKQNSGDTNSLSNSSSSQDSCDENFTKKFPQAPHNTPIQPPKKLHYTPSGSSSSLSHELFK